MRHYSRIVTQVIGPVALVFRFDVVSILMIVQDSDLSTYGEQSNSSIWGQASRV